ncbi:MAG: glycosyltransferase [Proteobacteria bacterium]|nr:glycosyltransferase [Pseudomonadota bacterium]
MSEVGIVVPCYNEAARLPLEQFRAFRPDGLELQFVFVNDGSTDDTLRVLRALEKSDPQRFSVVDRGSNGGKADAVRLGMLEAFRRGFRYVGYWDADLSTPLEEIPRFVDVLETHPQRDVVFGARVQLLGRSIRRNSRRHYLGRVFATVVSNLLRLRVYDTQCGAKLFRASDETASLFAEPFATNWVFDVEVIARMIASRRANGGPRVSEAIYELPLLSWRDVAGSKVRAGDFLRAPAEIARIYLRYLRRG